MKLLQTDAQSELQELLSELSTAGTITNSQRAQLQFWSIELRPKRVRRLEKTEVTEEVTQGT